MSDEDEALSDTQPASARSSSTDHISGLLRRDTGAAAELDLAVAREAVRGQLFPAHSRPARVDRYELRQRLGEGGMGIVFSAYDPQLDREVAIKVVRPDLGSAALPERLLREAQAIARLSHPNVVSVFDAGTHEGEVFIAMELVRGVSLATWLHRPRTTAEIATVFAQAARGLAAAHRAGLVHRDFKPGNVLIGADDRVRVVDFGLARPVAQAVAPELAADFGSGSLKATDAFAGTPAYMAPEQALGATLDARTDQFAFCVCLYEALFGRRPFRGDTFLELRRALLEQPLELPASGSALPEALREVVERGLARQREQRFANMDEVLSRLEPLAGEGRPSSAPSPSAPAPAAESRLTRYLSELPAGVESYPECQAHSAVCRYALSHWPLTPAPGLAHVLDAIARHEWVPEAYARVVLAALYDAHFSSPLSWAAFMLGAAQAQLASKFFRFSIPPAGASSLLIQRTARSWELAHRGTELAVTEADEESGALVLSFPARLVDELGSIELLEWLRACFQGSGATYFEARIAERTATTLGVDLHWVVARAS